MMARWRKISRYFRSIFPVRERTLVIIYTTDVHGFIYPYDYVLGRETHWGLARIATLIEKYRKQYPDLILLDNGDFLQGSPLTYYYNFLRRRGSHPVARVMNALRYDAASVGNHDIEQGPGVYHRVRRQLRFPWLSANAKVGRKRSYFQPYTIREFGDLKVAILGLTTPAIPLWLNPDVYPGIRWQDMVSAARGWLPFLQESRKADVIVGLFHAGIHPNANRPDWPDDVPEENPCLQIAEALPAYDVILAAHEHRLYNSHPMEGEPGNARRPLVMMAGSHGRHLGVIFLKLKKQKGRWRVIDKWGKIENARREAPHPRVIRIMQPYHRHIMRYINSQIGYARDTISSRYSRLKDGGFVDLIHQTQFRFSEAEVSFAASFTTTYVLKKGPIRIRDVYGLYKYENYLYLVILTGQQIIDHLEWAAQYFNTVDPRNPLARPLINPDFMGFNYDTAEGISYQIDLTRPVGERLQHVRLSDTNEPIDRQRKFRVAVNSYRAQQRRKRFRCPIVWKSNKEIRDLLVEYIREKKEIVDKPTQNWKLIPEWIVEKYIRERLEKDFSAIEEQ